MYKSGELEVMPTQVLHSYVLSIVQEQERDTRGSLAAEDYTKMEHTQIENMLTIKEVCKILQLSRTT